MTPGLAGVGHSEFEDPATLVDRPEQPRGIPVILLRPKSEHRSASEKIGNSDAVVLTEVGMRVAVTTIINRARIAARAAPARRSPAHRRLGGACSGCPRTSRRGADDRDERVHDGERPAGSVQRLTGVRPVPVRPVPAANKSHRGLGFRRRFSAGGDGFCD